MATTELIMGILAAYLSLTIFSFLYRDNAFFRISEHAFVGLNGGIILYQNLKSIYTTTIQPISGGKFLIIIPAILGILSLTLFSSNYRWLYRYSISFVLALGLGLTIRAIIFSGIISQLTATITAIGQGTSLEVFGNLYVFIGVLVAVFYFIGTIEHVGAPGTIGRLGRLVIMLAFGAAFAGEMNWGLSTASGPFFTIARPPGLYLSLIAGLLVVYDIYRRRTSSTSES